jgi:DNA-directed RNA polymerase specialized sigma24 family protein
VNIGGLPRQFSSVPSGAFLELLGNIGRIDAGPLSAGLHAVVRRRAIDRWRRHKREATFTESRQDAAKPAEFPFDRGNLESGGLNASHRLCPAPRCVHGMSHQEIAEFTGLRGTRVGGRLRCGLELPRETLAGERRAKQE